MLFFLDFNQEVCKYKLDKLLPLPEMDGVVPYPVRIRPKSHGMPGEQEAQPGMSSKTDSVVLDAISATCDLTFNSHVDSDINEDSDQEFLDQEELEEDALCRAVENRDIYITRVLKSDYTKDGKPKKHDRVYNAYFACPYKKVCGKSSVTNFTQHISRRHKHEPAVKKILSLPLNERRTNITLLRNRACNEHNVAVLSRAKGELFVGRRTSQTSFKLADYSPCPKCFLWLRTVQVHCSKHEANCVGNDQSAKENLRRGMLKRKRPDIQRFKWSAQEEQELRHLFKHHFLLKKSPRTRDCKRAILNSKRSAGVIYLRKYNVIKSKVSRMVLS